LPHETTTAAVFRAGFCWWGPGANIEDGSSLSIHWSSGSHKRSTNLAIQYDIYFRNSIVCMAFSTRVPLAVYAQFESVNLKKYYKQKIIILVRDP